MRQICINGKRIRVIDGELDIVLEPDGQGFKTQRVPKGVGIKIIGGVPTAIVPNSSEVITLSQEESEAIVLTSRQMNVLISASRSAKKRSDWSLEEVDHFRQWSQQHTICSGNTLI